ncbi:ABC transporter permease [Actinocatenispora rupis]|uniref:ABC transporter permease n=1 Tax=Actinocatenispora rupis TaxID=519421 RepID=A0A8J3J8C5_9ACTN|nr:ABC transporter permease [Actinocatenispora rupis]GID11248.1 ABC transporter permease [Actinocatenispora rupis]
MTNTSLEPVVAAGWTRRRGAAVSLVQQFALIPVIVVLCVVGAFVSDSFLTLANFTNVGQQVSALGVVVVAETLILVTGSMDLSLQSNYGLSAMVAAWLVAPVAQFGLGVELNPLLGLAAGIVVGGLIGAFNGTLIVKAKINGFILTLAMYILLAGVQTGIVSGHTIYHLPKAFIALGAFYFADLPVSVWVAAAVFVAAGLYLRYTRTGRALYAIGGNREAARAAGIKVDRIRIGVFVVGGALAALGGLMEAGRVVAVTANQGTNLIFTVFAAAVIGGVSLNGGRGNMLGAATGVVLLGLVQNILALAQVQSYWIDAVDGAVILVALALSRVVGGERSTE